MDEAEVNEERNEITDEIANDTTKETPEETPEVNPEETLEVNSEKTSEEIAIEIPSHVPEIRKETFEVDESADENSQSTKIQVEIYQDELPSDKIAVTTTSTKNALITTPLESCDNPHRVKISIIGAGRVGTACAISILMKRIASEVCLIDKDSSKAEAEAEDMRHGSVFLGNPLVTGTSDITMVCNSAVVIIAIGDGKSNESTNVKHNLEIFRKVIPAIAKLACRAILLIVTQPIDVMSYVAWKISKFPSNRVLGTGTLVDSMRFRHYLGERLGLANSSISCTCIGSQGDHSVLVWSNVHVGGVKLRDINPRIGESEDPEKWNEIDKSIHESDGRLDAMKGEKGPNCWALGICTAEIVDAIVRNTRIVLTASTYIHVGNMIFLFAKAFPSHFCYTHPTGLCPPPVLLCPSNVTRGISTRS